MVIDNLAKRGLVFRKKTKEDRRYYWIYLTREGEKLIEKIFPAHVRLITDRLAILNEQEQLQFAQLCKKLGKYQEENKK
jgi:MarR family 2-MHQ and catechol resistance regulon transcriptional repressor